MAQQQTFGAWVRRARQELKHGKGRAREARGLHRGAHWRKIASGRSASTNAVTAFRLADVLNDDPLLSVLGVDSPIIPW